MKNLTTEQIESVLIDYGQVYLNYNTVNERELAPIKGGSSFVVEQEIKDIEYDGMRGKTKGMRRIISENAYVKLNLMGLTQENIKLALAGANLDEVTRTVTNGIGTIPDSDYIDSITIIGMTMGGKYKVITLYNALADNGLSMAMTDKEESVVELQIYAHYEPSNLSSPIYKIEDVTVLD